MTTTEKKFRTNLREIRRLQIKLATGDTGRNVGATENALDRRLDLDRRLLARLADEEAEEARMENAVATAAKWNEETEAIARETRNN